MYTCLALLAVPSGATLGHRGKVARIMIGGGGGHWIVILVHFSISFFTLCVEWQVATIESFHTVSMTPENRVSCSVVGLGEAAIWVGSLGFMVILLRRRYTIRFARTEPADCPVHGSIVTCDMSLECPGHLKIG